MAVRTKRFDPADYLTTDEALAEYINAALETNDAAFIADSLGIVARAKGISAWTAPDHRSGPVKRRAAAQAGGLN